MNWKIIARTIVPFDSFPGPADTRYTGFGDIQEQWTVPLARIEGTAATT